MSDDNGDTEIQQLRNRVAKAEDYSETYLKNRVDDLEAENDALREELNEVRGEIAELKNRIEAFTGPQNNRSPPEKRASDLRHALISSAKEASAASTNDGGSKKHYRDAWESLAEAGHTDLSKPDVYDAMEDAAEADGFFLGKKTHDGKKIKAVGVKTDDLPAHESSSDSTTQNSAGTTANGQSSAARGD